MNKQIRQFIEDRFLIEFDDTFPEDTDLFRAGVIDSFGYVQLCRFLESTFHFKFSEGEIAGNVLVSLSRIEDYVARKLESQVASAKASGSS
jgi:D-alanine--poly(phosphoribitol) ligase subunit 2